MFTDGECGDADTRTSYTLTFLLLAAEMATFCVLVFPLPHTIRKKLFHFLSESPIIAKLAYGIKIAFMFVPFFVLACSCDSPSLCRFIAILFVDAVQRMWRVTAEADLAKSAGSGAQDVRAETNMAARKF